MEFIYKLENSDIFENYWESYIRSNLSSYKYTLLNLDYMLFYSQKLSQDYSFVVTENSKPVGICFLPIEENYGYKTVSLANGYTMAPLSNNSRVEKKIFQEIEKIVEKNDIQQIKFYIDPLISEYGIKFNYLKNYGFLDSSASDCLLDLIQDIKELWKNLRKSYKSLINSILNSEEFEVVKIDFNNSNYEIHEEYRNLHRLCAGRETRIKDTFDKQFEMLEQDQASLFGLKHKGKFIGFNYFFHFQKTVVYASGADNPEYENLNLPIYHSILWSAFLYYKERGFDFMQFSQPCGFNEVDGFDDYLDQKQINISHFKRGTGTEMRTLYRGIKYYDKKLLEKDLIEFKKRLL